MSKQTIIKNEFGHLQFEQFMDETFFHLELHKWSKDLYKEYKEYFDSYLELLKNKGIKRVFTMIKIGDEKLEHFQNMFGFYRVFEQNGYLVMKRDL